MGVTCESRRERGIGRVKLRESEIGERGGPPSVIGTAALPYTVAEEEKTMARQPWRSISLSSVTVEPRLFS